MLGEGEHTVCFISLLQLQGNRLCAPVQVTETKIHGIPCLQGAGMVSVHSIQRGPCYCSVWGLVTDLVITDRGQKGSSSRILGGMI